MAPRRRRRKSGNTRMDAAIDAMTKTYGFPEEIVKRVVKELLKEYEGDEGDEGWFFIEQYSYQELIDAILRGQEKNDQDNPPPPPDQKEDALPLNVSLQDERAEENALADAVGPSGVLAETNCSKVVDNGLETSIVEDVDHLPPNDKVGEGWKDIGLDQCSRNKERADAICYKDDKSGSSQDHANSLLVSPPPLTPTTPLDTSVPRRPEKIPVLSALPRISSPPRVKSAQSRRRQPCNGWIDSDEEEVDDFIELTPAVEWEDLTCGTLKKAKRRSRWDLRP